MAEKIKIFELDIDVDQAIKASKDLKEESLQLKTKLNKLKEAGDENTKEFVEMEAQYKNVRKQYNSSQRELGKLIDLQGNEIKTIEQGRNALSVISKEWAKQADLYGVNSKEADKLAKKKTELTESLKELESQTGDNTRNVGNYKDALGGAAQQSDILMQAQEAAGTAMAFINPVIGAVNEQIAGIKKNYVAATAGTIGFSTAQKAAAIGTNMASAALKLFRIALISTGIGAIVVALGSLVAYFTSTEQGINFVNQALAYLKAAFDVIIDRFAKFGAAIVSFLSGNFSEGIDQMTSAFKGMGDEIARETKLAVKLENVLHHVKKASINLDIRRAAANARLNQIKKTIEDTSASIEDRIAASKKFAKIEQGLLKEEVANQEKKVAAMLGYAKVTDEVREKIKQIGKEGVKLSEIGIDTATIKDMKAFRDEVVELYDLQEKSLEKQTENQNSMNSLIDEYRQKQKEARKEQMEAAKEATEAALEESETRLKIFIEENKGKADSLKESLEFAKKIRDKKLGILKRQLDAGELKQAEYELAVLKTKNEYLEKQKNLTVEYAQKELKVFKSNHQSRLENNQLLNDQLVAQEINRLERIADAEKAYQAKRLDEGKISQQEYNQAIANINAQFRAKKTELQNQYKQQQAEAEAVNIENKRAIQQQRMQYDLQLQLHYMNMKKQQELQVAREKGASLALIQQKYAQIEEQIRAQVESNKLNLASKTFANMATIMGKQSAAGKAMAVAQTTIDTYQSATAAFKAMAGIPIVGPALGAIAAAAAVASGLKSVQKIVSTKKPDIPKAEKGALFDVGGKRHHSGGTQFYGEDGTQFEAEEGELIGVMNRRAAMMFKGFNDEYRGNSTSSDNYLAGGGFVWSSTLTTTAPMMDRTMEIDYDKIAQSIGREVSQANRLLPRPVTDVKDIVGSVVDYNRVVDGANL